VRESYERRRNRRQPYRNGYYERDFVTRMGTIRLRVARTRGKSFLPRALEPFQRPAEDVAMLITPAKALAFYVAKKGTKLEDLSVPANNTVGCPTGKQFVPRDRRAALAADWALARMPRRLSNYFPPKERGR
jgi:putative transposase